MPHGLTRSVNVPAAAGAQTIIIPDVFTDADGQDAFNVAEVMKIPDVGPAWINWFGGTAVIDGPDTVLAAEGSPWSSFPIGNMRFRQGQRANRPDLHISIIYGPNVAGWIEFTFY